MTLVWTKFSFGIFLMQFLCKARIEREGEEEGGAGCPLFFDANP